MPNFIPAEPARSEIRVSNSRFIASAAPTPTVDEAKAFIAAVRAEMPDATHHVYAFVVGHGATTTMGMSDDGEPSGTAGRPVLSVVKGSGLGDVTVVVTRYFGGTLLGTGGLVHAYGDAAKDILAKLARVEKIARSRLLVAFDYSHFEPIRRLIAAHEGAIADEQFAADVTLTVVLPQAQAAPLSHAITELTAGRAEIAEEEA